MATGRIVQEIALKILGLDDAKDLDRTVTDLSKKTTTVKVNVDTGTAGRDVDQLLTKVDGLARHPAELLLTSNAVAIEGDIAELVLKLDTLDDPHEIRATSDQINSLSGDLDRVTGKLKELSSTDVAPNVSPNTRQGLDKMVTGADQAQSAVANLAGNVGQDMGAMIGITGSAGVALGQFAEYFTETAVKAREAGQGIGEAGKAFAAALAPVAALIAISSSIGSIFQAAADRADRLAEATDLLAKSAGQSTTAIADSLRENADAMRNFDADARTAWGGFVEGATAAANAIPLLGSLIPDDAAQNISDVAQAFSDAGISAFDLAEAFKGGRDIIGAYATSLEIAAEQGKITSDQLSAGKQQLEVWATAADNAEGSAGFFATTIDELNQMIADAGDPLTQYTDQWKTLMDDMRDGKVTSQAAADAVDVLSKALGKTPDQIRAIAQAGLDDQLQAQADAAKEAAQAYTDQAAGIQAATDAAQAYSDVVSSTDFGAAGLQGAADGAQKFFDQAQALPNIAAGVEEAFDSMGAAVAANGVTFDTTTEAGRNNLSQLEQLSTSIVPHITAAYEGAGGSVEKFGQSMAQVRQNVIDGLTATGQVSVEQAGQIADALGLIPDNVTTQYELIGAAKAQAQLQLLSGVIDDLPPDIQRQVFLAIKADDPAKAMAIIDDYFAKTKPNDVTVGVDADPTAAAGEVDGWVQATNATTGTTTLATNGQPATATTDGWKRTADGTTGTATLGANGQPARAIVDGWEANANAARGTGTLGATKGPADAVIDGWEANANAARGTANLNAVAHTTQANSDLDNAAKTRTATINAIVKFFSFADGGTVGSSGGIAGEAGPEFATLPDGTRVLLSGATPVPPGTRVTSARRSRMILGRSAAPRATAVTAGGSTVIHHTTNVNAAVVGSRYEVAKAVGQGNRDLLRLVGARGVAG